MQIDPRTAWHSRARGQTLHITSGVAYPGQSTTWLEHVSDEEYLAGGAR